MTPNYHVDFYSDDFIVDPFPRYREMRALGDVVRMAKHDIYAITRFAPMRAALRDHQVFSSASGVAADAFGCKHLQGNTVASDPPRHTALRGAIAPMLRPDALEAFKPVIREIARTRIAELRGDGAFDAVTEIAQYLPLRIVRDLVGLPDFGRENMLKWAAAAFNVLGVQNDLGRSSLADIEEMRSFIGNRLSVEGPREGSWTAEVFAQAARGELAADLAPFAIRDLINPSLDTTISAIGELVHCLGTNPAAWASLKTDPGLARAAAHEAVRMATPIRSFTRRVTHDTDIAGEAIPAGSRVMMVFASANRDEREFEKPDDFDLFRRNGARHLGFGAGIHTCVGMHLALLELEAVAVELASQVERIDVGSPKSARNNTIRAYASLPVTLI